MLKNISQLEYKIGDKVYHLLCDNDSPLEHVIEAANQFLKFVLNVQDQVKAAQDQKAKEELAKQAVVPESKVEEMPKPE